MSRIKITSGEYRGRFIETDPELRPTSELVRKALFDIIGNSLIDKQFIDLFAGSGAVGFEAISRGATRATFIEKDSRHANLIKKNAQSLGATDRSLIRAMSVNAFIEANQTPYDYVFADPWYEETLDITSWPLQTLLAENGIIIIEHAAKSDPVAGTNLRILTRKRYGDTALTFYTRA